MRAILPPTSHLKPELFFLSSVSISSTIRKERCKATTRAWCPYSAVTLFVAVSVYISEGDTTGQTARLNPYTAQRKVLLAVLYRSMNIYYAP